MYIQQLYSLNVSVQNVYIFLKTSCIIGQIWHKKTYLKKKTIPLILDIGIHKDSMIKKT